MKPFTVIVRCLCGCDDYALHHVFNATPDKALAGVKHVERKKYHRKVEAVMVLKGHCEEV